MSSNPETMWTAARLAISSIAQTIAVDASTLRDAADWQDRADLLAALSGDIRRLSDAFGQAEQLVKSQAPPLCNLRIRDEPRRAARVIGVVNDMPADPNVSSGWLVLASDSTCVLEIEVGATEWLHQAAARFERACIGSPLDVLAGGIPAAKAVDR